MVNVMPGKPEIVALGSAIVDMFCSVSDDFVKKLDIPKGSMMLVGPELSAQVLKLQNTIQITSGGSAANTLVGLANLGHKGILIARTSSDELGERYSKDLEEIGVGFQGVTENSHLGTARCLVMVTPDGERTMATYLGAASQLTIDARALETIASARVLYIEGYLYDVESTRAQIQKACSLASLKSVKVALSLSDEFCVDRHKMEFIELIENYVDLVFANFDEATILTDSEDLNEIIKFFQDRSVSGAITLGAQGAMVFDPNNSIHVDPQHMETVIDTTGAGDLFAAGYLHGYLSLNDFNIKACGDFGASCAAEVISHFGARPKVNLLGLLARV